MKVIVKFDFVEGGTTRHAAQFTADVPQDVIDVINNDKAPHLAIGMFPRDPRVSPFNEVIDLEKLYPAADLDGYSAMFTEGDYIDSETGVNGKGWPPHGQVRREDEGARDELLDGLATALDVPRELLDSDVPRFRRWDTSLVAELKPIGPKERDSDQVHAAKQGLAAAARLTTEGGWNNEGPYVGVYEEPEIRLAEDGVTALYDNEKENDNDR